jgi:hypothetical protein
MSECPENPGDDKSPTKRSRLGLTARVERERWGIPDSLRRPLIDRLEQILNDPAAPRRDVLSAVSAVLTVGKINLANIAMTIRVHTYEDLEERMDEIERQLEDSERKQDRYG